MRTINRLITFGTITAFCLIGYALFSQHVGGYEPCVRCIYQRVAVLMILMFGMLAILTKKIVLLKALFLILVFLASAYGLYQSHIHVGVMNGTVADFCDFFPSFGFLGRLDLALPWLFEAGGDCADDSWKFLGFNMPEWMRVIFFFYLITSLWTLYLIFKNERLRRTSA